MALTALIVSRLCRHTLGAWPIKASDIAGGALNAWKIDSYVHAAERAKDAKEEPTPSRSNCSSIPRLDSPTIGDESLAKYVNG